jgi:hypothetical protein
MTAQKSEPHLGDLVAALAEGLKPAPASDQAFVLPVESVAEDRQSVKVRLCTGGSLEVPIAALKSAKRLGHALVDSQRFEIASGEIDRSSSSGRLLHHVAVELQRAAGTLQTIRGGAPAATSSPVAPMAAKPRPANQTAPRPFDYTVAPITIKLPVSGTAGQPVTVTYHAPQYHYIQNLLYPGDVGDIAGFVTEYVTFTGCFFIENQSKLILTPAPPSDPNVHGNLLTGVAITVDAQHGTPLGQFYFGSVWLKVTLIQETT